MPDDESLQFRCVRCGAVKLLPFGYGVLSAGESRGAPPCEACSHNCWVQVGSMTEFYTWTNRGDVCEVGQHPARNVREYRLTPTAPLPPGETKTSIMIKACPEHVEPLREHGIMGFFLRETRHERLRSEGSPSAPPEQG